MASSANISASSIAYETSRLTRLLRHTTTQAIVTRRIDCVTLRVSFGHLLANDAISLTALQVISKNEDDTTKEVVTGSMGLPTLSERFADPEIKAMCTGMLSLDYPKPRGSLSSTLRVSGLVPLLKTCVSISR